MSATPKPTSEPPTFAQVKAAIPKHCFVRSTATSFLYLFVDLCLVAALYSTTNFFNHPSLPSYAPFLLWPLYWIFQGFVFTGIWVIAHECGHHAFSDSKLVCDIVGFVLHSAMLVPYFSWQISHAKHHSKTNHLTMDEVHSPRQKKEGKNPSIPSWPKRLMNIVLQLVFGWNVYLWTHETGRDYGRPTNHFNPNSPLFQAKDYWLIVLSDIGLLATLSAVGFASYLYGPLYVFAIYGIPYIEVCGWLVLITLLQHTDPKLHHYGEGEWNWLRGALSTIDRDFGPLLNVMFHHIQDTHVLHHLVSTIPHYHAEEATEAIKGVLGEYYNRDFEVSWYSALWTVHRECRFVESDGSTSIFGWYNAKAQ